MQENNENDWNIAENNENDLNLRNAPKNTPTFYWWIILLFTVVGADTNIHAAFAIQWLFVFFNSFQGFFLFVFFVALNRDARNLWLKFLRPHLKTIKSTSSTRFKYSSTSGNTASMKVSSQKYFSSDVSKTADKEHNLNEESVVANTSTVNDNVIDDVPNSSFNLTTSSGEDGTTMETLSKEQSRDIETASNGGEGDEETSL